METTTKKQWDEVGSLLTGLGLKLQLHLEQTASSEKQGVTDALRALSEGIEHAFEALRNASGDDAIQSDVKNVARSISGAVAATFADVGSDLRELVSVKH
jgi:hypothetical protein